MVVRFGKLPTTLGFQQTSKAMLPNLFDVAARTKESMLLALKYAHHVGSSIWKGLQKDEQFLLPSRSGS